MNPKDVLMKAVQCDNDGRIFEALQLYQTGIEMLSNLLIGELDKAKKKGYYERLKDYIDRAEQIKLRVKVRSLQGEMVTNIFIEDDAVGHNYQTLFGKFLTADVKEMLLDESYLYKPFQFQNLIQFMEVVVRNCPNLTFIRLITKPDSSAAENQQNILEQIKGDLAKRNISLNIEFDEKIHDRKIVLSNGYIIKLGYGLHFFKPTNPQYSLGLSDYYFRKCRKTELFVYRTKNFEN